MKQPRITLITLIIAIWIPAFAGMTIGQQIVHRIDGMSTLDSTQVDTSSRKAPTSITNLYSYFPSKYKLSIWSPDDTLLVYIGNKTGTGNWGVVLPGLPYCRTEIESIANQDVFVKKKTPVTGHVVTYYYLLGGE